MRSFIARWEKLRFKLAAYKPHPSLEIHTGTEIHRTLVCILLQDFSILKSASRGRTKSANRQHLAREEPNNDVTLIIDYDGVDDIDTKQVAVLRLQGTMMIIEDFEDKAYPLQV